MESVVAAAVCGVAGVAAGPMIAAAATRAADGRRIHAPGWWHRRDVDSTHTVVVALSAGAGAAAIGARHGFAAPTAALCWLVITGVALALVDWRHRRLPNVLVVAAAVGGAVTLLAASVATRSLHPFGRALLAALAVFTALLALAVTARSQLGFGDVKLGGALGMYLGWFSWWHVAIGVLAGFMLAGLLALALLASGRIASWRGRVPLGPALLAGAFVTLLAAGSACTSQPGADQAPTGSPSTVSVTTTSADTSLPSPTSTNAEVEQRVRVAYIGMWMAMAEAGRTSDWQSPQVARYARDDALAKITQQLYSDHQRGITARGRPVLSPRITDLVPADLPTEARIVDCGDDRGWKRYDADGKPADDEPGGRRRITAILRLEAGIWKVVDFAIREVGSC